MFQIPSDHAFTCLCHLLVLDLYADMFVFSHIFCTWMLYYCDMVRWACWDWELSGWLTTLLQCFDTVGWVIRPVKLSFVYQVLSC